MKRKEIEEDIEKFMGRTFIEALVDLGVGEGFVSDLRECFKEETGDELEDIDLFVSAYITIVNASLRTFLSGMNTIWFESSGEAFEHCSVDVVDGLCKNLRNTLYEEYINMSSAKRRQ
jgi:hypothetical protein